MTADPVTSTEHPADPFRADAADDLQHRFGFEQTTLQTGLEPDDPCTWH